MPLWLPVVIIFHVNRRQSKLSLKNFDILINRKNVIAIAMIFRNKWVLEMNNISTITFYCIPFHSSLVNLMCFWFRFYNSLHWSGFTLEHRQIRSFRQLKLSPLRLNKVRTWSLTHKFIKCSNKIYFVLFPKFWLTSSQTAIKYFAFFSAIYTFEQIKIMI